MTPCMKKTDDNIFEAVGRYLDEWKYFYPNDQEMTPRNMSEALGKYVVIKSYVDANHSGNMSNRSSHYGIIIYVNNAAIIWNSKKQNTVEASIFGSEFVAIRIATDIIEALSIKRSTKIGRASWIS